MKVVKLNRRYKAFKEKGHTMGLRFKTCSKEVLELETQCHLRFGSRWSKNASWGSQFGSPDPNYHGYRPYWLTFKNEADLTLLLLTLDTK